MHSKMIADVSLQPVLYSRGFDVIVPYAIVFVHFSASGGVLGQ